MHPIVIMAYDKSPAITKAVAALEEAGMEVRVLNTAHAKLADFLGALAGEDDEEDQEPKDEPKTEDEPKEPNDDVSADELPAEEEPPIATEALICLVDGEEIEVQLVEGKSELVPNGLMVGSKTAYMVNESHFAFWPVTQGDGMFDLTHQVQVTFSDRAMYEDVSIAQPGPKALLKLNKETYAKIQEAK